MVMANEKQTSLHDEPGWRHDERTPEPAVPETVAEIGRVALIDVPIEWWWTQGSTYDLPTFGAEMLGAEF